MKKYLILITFVIFASVAFATVGGESLVYDLKFDAKTNSLYYVGQDYGGKGCPPELKSISLDTNTTKTIYSCDDGIQSGENQQQKINTYTANFPGFSGLNLNKNKISVSMDVIGPENIPGTSELLKTNFIANVYQGEIKKAAINISGCNIDQPFVIGGYQVPGQPDKAVLLFSGKGDCFEGGYVNESLHVISGMTLSNLVPVSSYKAASPLVPNEGTLVVYPQKSEIVDEPIPQSESSSLVTLVLGLVLGTFLGFFLGKRKRKNDF